MRIGVLCTVMYTGQRTQHHDTHVDKVRTMILMRASSDEEDTAMPQARMAMTNERLRHLRVKRRCYNPSTHHHKRRQHISAQQTTQQ